MTRKPLDDLFNMRKTAIPESRINGYSKKRFGICSAIEGKEQSPFVVPLLLQKKMSIIDLFPKKLNKYKAWLKRINKFILHLALWKWAAINHEDFCFFEISFTKIIRFIPNYCPYSADFFVLEIRISEPQLYCFEPFTSVYDYCQVNHLNFDTFDD